jgi:hypothetical protein
MLKQAVTQIGTTDPAKLTAAFESISYEGICGSYKTDANHNMSTTVTVVNFPNGTPTVVKAESGLTSPQ